jgi:enoyl-CoA hydratase/carnithine racemase
MDETSATITLNRPEAMNSINDQVAEEISLALDQAEKEPMLRCLVLTGAGGAFCVGADLKFVLQILEGEASVRDFLEQTKSLLSRLESFPAPVIGAVNGMALAGGLEILLCCDLIVAVESARFGDAHSNFGLIPGGGSSQRLPRRVGVNRAKQMIFYGDFYTAQDMERWGLVNQVVPDGELGAAVNGIKEIFAGKSPLVLRHIKSLVNQGLDMPLEEGLSMEISAMEEHAGSHDMREGVAAFKEKRPPSFQGR